MTNVRLHNSGDIVKVMVIVFRGKGLQTEREKLVEQQLYAEPQRCLKRPKSKSSFILSTCHRIIQQAPSFKLWLVLWKQQLRVLHHHQVNQTLSHLDGAVQRGIVQLLELRPDVLQVELRPSHHDSGQSRLISSAALTTTRARLYCAVDTETPSYLYLKLLLLLQKVLVTC